MSKETYSLAFEMLAGRPSAVRPKTDGRTDFQVIRELLAANPLCSKQDLSDSELEDALTSAMQIISPTLPQRGSALPGAREALVRLSSISGVTQSVLTGNIRRNAWVKLHAFHLDNLLDLEIGGYGSDHIVRSKLIDIARKKTLQKYGLHFSRSSTVMIGDTTRDVQAARDGNSKIIAVASGVTDERSLKDAGADRVLASLADVENFLSVLTELRISE